MGRKEDDENAYRTSEGMVGRSIRRGTRKAVSALTFGIVGGSDPVTGLAQDAAYEIVTKVIPRSREKDD